MLQEPITVFKEATVVRESTVTHSETVTQMIHASPAFSESAGNEDGTSVTKNTLVLH